MSEVKAVGHRVVHGGEYFSSSAIVDEDVLEKIEKCNYLAPLHNPANVIGIKACMKIMKDTPNVVVFWYSLSSDYARRSIFIWYSKRILWKT